VIDDPDIFRAAKLLIDQHGADAATPARFAIATRASGWTKTQFRCYIKPGCANGGRSLSRTTFPR
jgi:hypothetical protein